MDTIRIDHDISVGRQPELHEIREISDDRFRAVLDLREPGEKDLPVDPREEEVAVRVEGLDYCHIPVSPERLGEELVERFRRELDQVPKPAFVHCSDGERSWALVMMDRAVERGMSGEEAIEEAKELGFACGDEVLNRFVRDFVDARTGNGR